ncbi:Clec4e [Symbiodinium microadriaticum]|nr:Clec4e [Symbiodinium microadriaticum]
MSSWLAPVAAFGAELLPCMSEADDIEELTIRLGGVTISIRGALSGAGARGLASGDSAQGESASATHSLAGAHRRASEGEILAATSAQDLAALHLPELVPLARQLRGEFNRDSAENGLGTCENAVHPRRGRGTGLFGGIISAYLVRIRTGGFLAVLPRNDTVVELMRGLLNEDGDSLAVDHFCAVELETSRGRSLGEAEVYFVDLPWEGASAFTKSHPLRGALARETRFVTFEAGGSTGRPRPASTLAAAEAWIMTTMDATTATEYNTAAEEPDEPAETLPPHDGAAMDNAELYNALLDRIQALEAGSRPSASSAAPDARPLLGGPPLLRAPAAALDDDTLGRLQALAGPAPRKPPGLGARAKTSAAPPPAGVGVFRESELEALPDPTAADPFADLGFRPADPLQQILAAQLAQNKLLLEKLSPSKPVDDVTAALGASGSGSGNDSSGGIKGCLAREAFLRQVQDLPRVAEIVRANALRELGLDASREEPNLLKLYIERRLPLAGHRLLGYVASFAAEGWEAGARSQNAELQGYAARLAIFAEQASLDSGRLQLAWLLGGYPDPPATLWAMNRRSSLKPFSGLCHASWAAANLAYLKDLDYLEGRMTALNRARPSSDKDAVATEDVPATTTPGGVGQAKPVVRSLGAGALGRCGPKFHALLRVLLAAYENPEILRPIFCIVDALFHEGKGLPRQKVFELSRQVQTLEHLPKKEFSVARRIGAILNVVVRSGQFVSVEHRACSALFSLECFKTLARAGCVLSPFCQCAFGAPFEGATTVLHNKPWFLALACSCACAGSVCHFSPEADLLTAASREDFLARCQPSALAVYGFEPEVGDSLEAVADLYPLPFVRQLAAGSVSARRGGPSSLPTAALQQTADRLGLGLVFDPVFDPSLEPYPPRDWHEEVSDCRVAALLDSRVTIGAAAKGSTWRFDAVADSCRLKKLPARWLRFLLLLAGDIERNPGPVPCRPRVPRGSLDPEAGFARSTAHKMRKALESFESWLLDRVGLSLDSVLQDNRAAEMALRGFGLYLYSEGFPRYLLVYALTAVQNRCPSLRNHLAGAWQVDRKWQLAEPGECRSVLPAAAVRAALCLATLWGWYDWTGVVLLGFLAMLHPAEMLALTRRDLVFPADSFHHVSALFVYLKNPKTARFARRQHGKIDDFSAISVIHRIFGHLGPDDKLFPASMHTFRRLWDLVMERLGIPCRAALRGATPGVLRGSGATHFYQQSENLQLLAWRGRWARSKTLEYYLQEVAAQMLLSELPPESRSRILAFDRSCDAVLSALPPSVVRTGSTGGAAQY